MKNKSQDSVRHVKAALLSLTQKHQDPLIAAPPDSETNRARS